MAASGSTPTFIDRIQDRNGATVMRATSAPATAAAMRHWAGQPPPQHRRRRASRSPIRATPIQMVTMLEGVVERGTAPTAAGLGQPLAGKTGTTNDCKDAWFVGFSPDLVVGVWVGFDQPRSLGDKETGGAVAACRSGATS